MKLQRHLIAIASATLLATGLAAAQTTTPTPPTAPSATNAPAVSPSERMVPRRDRRAAMQGEKDQLKEKLGAGQNRADYAKILDSNGYRIATINADKKDYLEYEVVKGGNSYEVQLDFDKGATKATKVDVATNMWRADATKRMMKDANYKQTGALVADKDSRYSDRRYMKAWTDEKTRLEKALPPNLKLADYKSKIEQQGYKITAVNDREKDYVEYEIAKGENSYEVQIDIDPKTGMGKKIDVTSNLWEADTTDKATDKKVSKP
ncbi:MAG: hypothetical protein Q8N44_20195 [Rubrivivax sp.]|nr:hypothetical protein [Rubrivivax sp.]MDP3085996.1 hypothetical protein [Rubrivivax sp.]